MVTLPLTVHGPRLPEAGSSSPRLHGHPPGMERTALHRSWRRAVTRRRHGELTKPAAPPRGGGLRWAWPGGGGAASPYQNEGPPSGLPDGALDRRGLEPRTSAVRGQW